MKTVHTNRDAFERIEQPFARAKESVHRKAGDNTRVLVVDDNDSVREVLSWILSAMELDVITARDGREGLTLFREYVFDIILTDLNMPEMDGLSMARHIKKRSPHTPIILITGEINEISEIRKSTIPLGSQVDTVLFKPFRMVDIEKAVQEALGKANSRNELGVNSSWQVHVKEMPISLDHSEERSAK